MIVGEVHFPGDLRPGRRVLDAGEEAHAVALAAHGEILRNLGLFGRKEHNEQNAKGRDNDRMIPAAHRASSLKPF